MIEREGGKDFLESLRGLLKREYWNEMRGQKSEDIIKRYYIVLKNPEEIKNQVIKKYNFYN